MADHTITFTIHPPGAAVAGIAGASDGIEPGPGGGAPFNVEREPVDLFGSGTTLVTPKAILNLPAHATALMVAADAPPAAAEARRPPVSPGLSVTDTTLLRDPDDAGAQYYFPRYRLAQEQVDGKQQFRVRFAEGADGHWSLGVELEAFPAPELGEAGRAARPIGGRRSVVLHHLPTGSDTNQDHALGEITELGDGLRAVLKIQSSDLGGRTQVFQAMTTDELAARIVVRTEATVTVPDDHGPEIARLEREIAQLKAEVAANRSELAPLVDRLNHSRAALAKAESDLASEQRNPTPDPTPSTPPPRREPPDPPPRSRPRRPGEPPIHEP